MKNEYLPEKAPVGFNLFTLGNNYESTQKI